MAIYEVLRWLVVWLLVALAVTALLSRILGAGKDHR